MEGLETSDPTIVQLKKRKVELTDELNKARKNLQPHGSFDAKFWAQATLIEKISLERSEYTRKIAVKEHGQQTSPWEETEAGKNLLKQIEAERQSMKICEERAKSLDENAPRKRGLRATFMKLFTTSTMGLAITSTGAGKRSSSDQSAFRKRLIEAYQAEEPDMECLWCPILGVWVEKEVMRAAHIFPWRHGQETMDTIFGKRRPSEMFSERNGMLMHKWLEDSFDKGKLVIVPDLAPDTSISGWLKWCLGAKREYRVKILDYDWHKIDQPVSHLGLRTFRELDGKRLEFSNPKNPNVSTRPAARYLYFHYCMQVLQKAWQQKAQGKPAGAAEVLKAENGKFFWGTWGRYLPRNMLLAFVEELGHEYEDLLMGASCLPVRSTEQDLLLATGAAQAKRSVSRLMTDSGLIVESQEEEYEPWKSDTDDESDGDFTSLVDDSE